MKPKYAWGMAAGEGCFTFQDAKRRWGLFTSRGEPALPFSFDAALRFAECIRDNGVKDFPDPGADAPLIDTNRIPSTALNGGMSRLNTALRQCGEFAAAAGVTEPK